MPRYNTILNRVEITNANQQNNVEEKSELPSMEDDLRDIHGLLIGNGNVR
jgi:hypothetical protein